MELKEHTGHSTMPVTERRHRRAASCSASSRAATTVPAATDHSKRVREFMTPREKLIVAPTTDITFKRANDVIWDNKLNALPMRGRERPPGRSIVFRKDYDSHKANPNEMLDANKRYMVGAGINTRDYAERVPAARGGRRRRAVHRLLRGLLRVAEDAPSSGSARNYGETRASVGAGNVVDAEGFRFLADSGADFVKVGIGGGSICITRETKGIGRGQATALIDVCRGARRVLRGDRRLRPHLLRRRHRATTTT